MFSSIRPFFRAVGLSALIFGGKSTKEEKKPVYIRSRYVALQRLMVHVLPCLVSITVITLNLKGYFIGFELAGKTGKDDISNIALQVAAKLQELLIIASYTTIIVDQLRRDLLHEKKGIPFGLLSSGFLYTQLSYFWSSEFLASFSLKNNRRLIFITICGGFLATLAGPATAVLVIPRTIDFVAGSTTFYLNGIADIFWPSSVNLDYYLPKYNNSLGQTIDCASNTAYKSAVCPSGGYISLFDYFSASTFLNDAGYVYSEYASAGKYQQGPQGGIPVISPLGQVAPHLVTGFPTLLENIVDYTSTAHGAVTTLQQRLNFAWYRATMEALKHYPDSNQYTRFQYYEKSDSRVSNIEIPGVRVLCQQDVTINHNDTEVSLKIFPTKPVRTEWNANWNDYPLPMQKFPFVRQNRTRVANQTHHTFQWLDLDSSFNNDTFRISAAALVWNPSSSEPNKAFVCSVDARWLTGDIFTSYPGPFQSSHALNTRDRSIWLEKSILDAINFDLPSTTPGYMQGGATAMEALIDTAGVRDNSDRWLQYVISSAVVDAISRIGTYRAYNTSDDVEHWPFIFYNRTREAPNGKPPKYEDWTIGLLPPEDKSAVTEIKLTQTVTGLGYQTDGIAIKLSIALLLFHIFVALVDIIYTLGFRPITSGCWDSIAELITLAQQSTPAKSVLDNTWAGIARFATWKLRVRIRKSLDTPGDQLELYFGTNKDVDIIPEVDEDEYTVSKKQLKTLNNRTDSEIALLDVTQGGKS